MSWLSRAAARLVPAERRDWAEAVWAEADQVPAGLARLAWRAGGVRLIAREAMLARRAGRALVFAAAAAWVAGTAWPGSAGNPATALSRLDVVTMLPVLAGLPLLARWLVGPAAPGPLARVLRAGAYVAVLVLIVARASVDQVADNPAAVPHLNPDASVPALDGMIYAWLAQSGAVMYAVAPLGLTSYATTPWLSGAALAPVLLLAWVLLFGAPAAAGSVAARCYRGPGDPRQLAKARLRQGGAAGFLATGIGALVVTVLGTGTIALMPRAGWALRWLYPGQHLLAAVTYNRELTASVRAGGYDLILLFFPVIGLLIGLAASTSAGQPGPPPDGDGLPGPESAPDPPDSGQLAA